MENAYVNFLNQINRNQDLVLATIIKTKGSTPQISGASALFGSKGLISGTLGGGLMEAETEKEAIKPSMSGKNQLLEFSLQSDIQDDYGGICGGNASILIDRSPGKHLEIFRQLSDSISNEQPGVLLTQLSFSGNQDVEIKRFWVEENSIRNLDRISGFTEISEIQKAVYTGKPVLLKPDKGPGKTQIKKHYLYVEPIRNRSKLIIVGAGHIGRALTHLARLIDFEITVIDNRPEIASQKYLSSADKILVGPIREQLRKISITDNTFIVLITQGHRFDAEALKLCIGSGAAYIGMIGSRRKVGLMREQFINERWATAEEFDRVHAPIGLSIHADTIQEIAMSIAAELIKCRKEKNIKKHNSEISAIVLAAGESKRMGQQKLLMPYEDKTMIETILDRIFESKTDNVGVVVGYQPDQIKQQVKNYKVEISYNKNYRKGMLSSIQTGIENVPPETGAVFVFLGDQPMLKTYVIDQLIDSCRNSDKRIFVPVFKGKRGHPVLIDMIYKNEILNLDPDKGLQELMHIYPHDVLEVEVESPDILKDIDTIEDYEKELI